MLCKHKEAEHFHTVSVQHFAAFAQFLSSSNSPLNDFLFFFFKSFFFSALRASEAAPRSTDHESRDKDKKIALSLGSVGHLADFKRKMRVVAEVLVAALTECLKHQRLALEHF